MTRAGQHTEGSTTIEALTRASKKMPARLKARKVAHGQPAQSEPERVEHEEQASSSREAFRLLDLPLELRLRIYEEVLLVDQIIDLNPINFFNILPRMPLFQTCHQVHDEATHVFYRQPIALFPTHGRFFQTKKPLLARLPPRYRHSITTLAWRIGPGWSSPPRNQNTSPGLGLADCTNLKTLKLFIECDPSDTIFSGYRGKGATLDTYRLFCTDILLGIFEQVPSLRIVEIDAYPSVKKESPIVHGLRRHVERAGKKVVWGPLRGWDNDSDEPDMVGLEAALACMNISGAATRLVEVPA